MECKGERLDTLKSLETQSVERRAKWEEDEKERRRNWKPVRRTWEMVDVDGIVLVMEEDDFLQYLHSDEREARKRAALEKNRRSWPCREWCSCEECEPGDYIRSNSQFISGLEMWLVPGFEENRLMPDFFAQWRFYESTEAFWAEYRVEDDEDGYEEELDYEWEEVLEREVKKWKKTVGDDYV